MSRLSTRILVGLLATAVVGGSVGGLLVAGDGPQPGAEDAMASPEAPGVEALAGPKARSRNRSAMEAVAGFRTPAQDLHPVPYNGRFTFTRVRYNEWGSEGGRLGGWRRGWRSAWNHDYPAADRNMQTILAELTALDPNTGASNVVDLEDPRVFRSPILYMSEPGFWTITEEGATNLRAFLLKGGFLMFDDFERGQWDNMAAQVARALPEGIWTELDGTHPIFQSFFRVDDIYVPHPLVAVTPRYMAIFEDNDPTKRVMVLANHNSDLAEYWEWSATGYLPVDPSNDAYRLGVNYIVYGITR